MARIIIIGGHGKIALLAEPLLAEAGNAVDAVIRNPEHADAVAATGATPVIADVETLDTVALTELIRGHDVVIWSAGAGGGNPQRTYAVDQDAAIRSIDAAAAAGVQRYVMVSYFGAGDDHGVDPENSFYAYAEAKSNADAYLRGAGIAYTIVAPSTLTLDAPTGRIDATTETSGSVARADVAAVIAAVVEAPEAADTTIRFNTGDTPIADAVRTLDRDA